MTPYTYQYKKKKKLNNGSYNMFDLLLILLISLQVFGNIGGSLQAVRVFGIICIPFVLSFFARNRNNIRNLYKYEFFLFFIWFVYALITLFWAKMPSESLKSLTYLFINIFLLFTVVFLANKAKNPQRSIINGWVIFFILTIPIALYEIWFDYHLPTSIDDVGSDVNFNGEIIFRRFASVTYGNRNGYNYILTYIMPFIFAKTLKTKNKPHLLFQLVLILSLSYIVLINSSRGAIICLLLGYSLFFLFLFKRKSKIIISIIFIAILCWLLYGANDTTTFALNRFLTQGMEDNSRTAILYYAWDSFLNSNMFGAGIGNFGYELQYTYYADVYAPHNLFLEVITQYGLVIFLLFIGLFFRIFFKNKNKSIDGSFIIIFSMILLPFSSIINSYYLPGVHLWLFLASIIVLSKFEEKPPSPFQQMTKSKN